MKEKKKILLFGNNFCAFFYLVHFPLDIPLIQTHLGIDDERNREFSINLFPAQTILNDAIFEVVNFLNWTRAALIYEQNYGNCLIFEQILSWTFSAGD